jgi:hypothetical protein
VPLKVSAIQLQRMRSKQTVMALAAIGVIGQSSGGNTVYGIAVRTDNVLGITHGRYPVSIDDSCPY